MNTQTNARATALEAQEIELDFWRNSEHESPESESIDNILNKAAEARVFLARYRVLESYFANAENILELGGGQCWSSCLVKRFQPAAYVVGSDLSPSAIASVRKWLPIVGAQPDRVVPCVAYDTPFADASFDLIYAFSAAHHFRKHRKCFLEIRRLLRPGGVALYISEPSSNRFLYKAAFARVNRKRPEVPEDLLIRSRLQSIASELGLGLAFHFTPTTLNRGPIEGFYFWLLSKFNLLQRIFPCTVDVVIRKPGIAISTKANDYRLAKASHRPVRS